MLKQIRTKILPILLIFVMLFCSMGAAFVDGEKLGRRYVVTENGVTYYIQQVQSKYKSKVIVTTNSDSNYTEISFDKRNKTVTST